ncbi:response regulator [Desulfonatronum parangueonense]
MSDDLRRQILLEIALSISGELELQSLLGKCLPLFLRKLNCTAAAVVRFTDQDPVLCKALPATLIRGREWSCIVNQLCASAENTDADYTVQHGGNLSCFGFILPDFGMLILARPTPFDPIFLKDFQPLTEMLARACQACLEVERRQAVERELAQVQASQRALLDNLPFLAWMKDDQGCYTAVNKAFSDATGIRVEEVIGKTTHDVWPRAKADIFHADDAKILRDALPVEGRDQDIASDGTVRWFEYSKRPIMDNSDAVCGTTGFRWEITDRVQAEQALERRRAFQRVVMDLAIGFVNTPLEELDKSINNALDMIGRFAEVDRAYLFRYDFTKAMMHNTHEWCALGINAEISNLQNIPNSLVPEWVQAHVRGETIHIPRVATIENHDLRRLLESQGVRTLITLPLIQGSVCYGFVGFDAVREEKVWSDEEISLLKILAELFANAEGRRIHEQHLIEAKAMAEAASMAKSEFLANMSHEIRTPLHGVVSMIGLLQGTKLTSNQAEFLSMAESSAESLLSVINDILDFSKIEAGKLELSPRLFNLEEEVYRLAGLVSAKAREKELELLVRYDPKAPRFVMADNLRLRQILSNLLTNALKFTEKGHVLLNVELLFRESKQVGLQFLVEDTGIGIPEHRLNQIFEKFTQVDGSTSRKYGGTGLGLAISQQLVTMMGGTITVGSTVGRGSRFFFELVLPWNEAAEGAGSLVSLQEYRALIVDDKAINRRIFSEYLHSWGVNHDSAESGPDALRMLEQVHDGIRRPYDFVLLDHAMPGMSGLKLAEILRKDPRWKHVRLIMLTSMWGLVDMNENRTFGLSAFLPKPVAASDLYNTIRDCLLTDSGVGAETCSESITDESEHAHEQESRPELPLIQVLLVDDHPINRKSASMLLQAQGCAVTTARNGLEAIDLLHDKNFDIVFMDVQMPVMDGLETTQAIRNMGGRYRNLPIIALTANAMDGDRQRCLSAGMTDYLPKPLPRDALGQILIRHRPSQAGTAPELSPLPPEGPVLNITELLTHYDDDPAIAREMLLDFLADAPSDIRAIAESVQERDPQAEQAAHRFKGPCAYIGAERLQRLCSMIIEAVRLGQWNTADHLASVLQESWESFATESRAWLNAASKEGHALAMQP